MLNVVLELALMLLRILREILGLARDIKQPRRHDDMLPISSTRK